MPAMPEWLMWVLSFVVALPVTAFGLATIYALASIACLKIRKGNRS